MDEFSEKSSIEYWFDKYYTIHEQKYRRLIALGIEEDEGINVKSALFELYQNAEKARKKIQELELK